jgi:hypothetical protein
LEYESPYRQKRKYLPFRKLQPPGIFEAFTFLPIRSGPLFVQCCSFWTQIGHIKKIAVRAWLSPRQPPELQRFISIVRTSSLNGSTAIVFTRAFTAFGVRVRKMYKSTLSQFAVGDAARCGGPSQKAIS